MSERRRALTSAFVAAAVLVAAVTAIVAVGRSSPPPLPTLAEQPEPRVGGAVAYIAATDDDGSCVVAVDLADGAERTRACTDSVLHTAAVTDDGVVTAVGVHPGGQLVVTVDADGAVDERIVDGDDVPELPDRLTRQPAVRGDGMRVTTGHGDDATLVTVIDADGRIHAERRFDGGRGYAISHVGWTGDEQWVLLGDTAGRLIVADDRLRHARVVADDVDGSPRPPTRPGPLPESDV